MSLGLSLTGGNGVNVLPPSHVMVLWLTLPFLSPPHQDDEI